MTRRGRAAGPVPVLDLLRLAYSAGSLDPASGALDCGGVCREVLARLGLPRRAIPLTAEELSQASQERSCWRRIGDSPSDAGRLGDLVLTRSGDGEDGALVVYQDHPQVRLLTAALGRGVFGVPPRMVRGTCMGVWRYEPSWTAST